MRIDLTKKHIIYPSWAALSYKWEDLPTLLKNPLATKYIPIRRTVSWEELGYSKVTDNFELVAGPFGNGIVVQDPSKMTDAKGEGFWLPSLLLGSEADYTLYPGFAINRFISQYRGGSYLSPKRTDEELLGLKKRKDDPMPAFSLEPLEGLENSALLCVGRTGSRKLDEDLEMLPAFLLAFGVKAERLEPGDEPTIQKCTHVQGFLDKWKLNGTWYFLDAAGFDAGRLLAIIVYLGGHLRSIIGSRIKSCHLVTTLPGHEPMCPRWNMMKLR